MKPHFDRCIDDFGKRLSEFVSNAGNTLYKGISEILDRTMSERRERSGEIGELRQATSTQIAAVKATNAALRQLRDGIWAEEDEPATPPAPETEPADHGGN